MEDRFVFRVAIGASIVWLVWFFHPSLAERMMVHWNGEKVGQWGDSFGALNALMSTLAFAAVLYTLRLQQRQIDDAQRDQHIQRFESSYFELLRLFREARAAIKFEYGLEYRKSKGYASNPSTNIIRVGRAMALNPQTAQRQGDEAFRAAMIEFRYWMQSGGVVGKSNINLLAEIYTKRIHDRYEGQFGPYFRLMYTILQRISEDDKLSPNEKARYGNLLRSQISSYEAAIAGFNGLSPVSKDFSRLITEFRLLKYLPSGTTRRVLERHYPPEAFNARD
ncbi:putative phage abortive infection protein [Mesorhizobium sp. M0870]|uniref:putative phage abortive infection protein n=1 Tax=Mesorhizobium sp. M0870 TaxID=2957016 RepID=UPI00333B9453